MPSKFEDRTTILLRKLGLVETFEVKTGPIKSLGFCREALSGKMNICLHDRDPLCHNRGGYDLYGFPPLLRLFYDAMGGPNTGPEGGGEVGLKGDSKFCNGGISHSLIS